MVTDRGIILGLFHSVSDGLRMVRDMQRSCPMTRHPPPLTRIRFPIFQTPMSPTFPLRQVMQTPKIMHRFLRPLHPMCQTLEDLQFRQFYPHLSPILWAKEIQHPSMFV